MFNIKIEDLEEILNSYDQGNPIISDNDYDALNIPKSSNYIKSMPSYFDYKTFYKALCKFKDIFDGFSILVEPKIDGMSLLLRYQDGILISAITKGNLRKNNKEVLNNIKDINIPLKLEKFSGLIRGELTVDKNFYKEFLSSEFSSPRNAVCGAVLSKNNQLVIDRKVVFVAFEFSDLNFKNYIDSKNYYQNFFLVMPTLAIYNQSLKLDLPELLFSDLENNYNFFCDGLVYKLNDFEQQNQLGSTLSEYRWILAWKPKSDKKYSKVLSIDYQISQNGKHVPVLNISPITFTSSSNKLLIKKVSAANCDFLKKKEIGIDSIVAIELRSTAIPVITEVIEKYPNILPLNCVCCGSNLINYCCLNKQCPERKSLFLSHLFKVINFKDSGVSIGKKGSKLFINYIDNIFDLLEIKRELLLEIFLKNKKNSKNSLKAVNKKIDLILNFINKLNNEITANQILESFNISMLGNKISKLSHFKDLYSLQNEELTNLQKLLGKSLGNYLYDFLKDLKIPKQYLYIKFI